MRFIFGVSLSYEESNRGWYVTCHGVHTYWTSCLCLYLRLDSVLSFKCSSGQKHQKQRWTKRAVNKHTRFTETGGDNTQPQSSSTLHKVQSGNCWILPSTQAHCSRKVPAHLLGTFCNNEFQALQTAPPAECTF